MHKIWKLKSNKSCNLLNTLLPCCPFGCIKSTICSGQTARREIVATEILQRAKKWLSINKKGMFSKGIFFPKVGMFVPSISSFLTCMKKSLGIFMV